MLAGGSCPETSPREKPSRKKRSWERGVFWYCWGFRQISRESKEIVCVHVHAHACAHTQDRCRPHLCLLDGKNFPLPQASNICITSPQLWPSLYTLSLPYSFALSPPPPLSKFKDSEHWILEWGCIRMLHFSDLNHYPSKYCHQLRSPSLHQAMEIVAPSSHWQRA